MNVNWNLKVVMMEETQDGKLADVQGPLYVKVVLFCVGYR